MLEDGLKFDKGHYNPEEIFEDLHFPIRVLKVDVGDQSISPHSHDFIEIVLVADGTGEHHLGNAGKREKWKIVRGDLFALAPNDIHHYTHCRSLIVYNFLFTAELITSIVPELQKLRKLTYFLLVEPLFRRETAFHEKFQLNRMHLDTAMNIMDKIIVELRNKEQGYMLMVRALFTEFMILLDRICEGRLAGTGNGAREGMHAAVERALEYIREQFASDLSLEDIALHACVSPNYFCDLFREYTGTTAWDFLAKVRIERAMELLAQTHAPVAEIAGQVGFYDACYFTKVFKDRMGVTPTAYRKSVR